MLHQSDGDYPASPRVEKFQSFVRRGYVTEKCRPDLRLAADIFDRILTEMAKGSGLALVTEGYIRAQERHILCRLC